jgi:hypothetical protein
MCDFCVQTNSFTNLISSQIHKFKQKQNIFTPKLPGNCSSKNFVIFMKHGVIYIVYHTFVCLIMKCFRGNGWRIFGFVRGYIALLTPKIKFAWWNLLRNPNIILRFIEIRWVIKEMLAIRMDSIATWPQCNAFILRTFTKATINQQFQVSLNGSQILEKR